MTTSARTRCSRGCSCRSTTNSSSRSRRGSGTKRSGSCALGWGMPPSSRCRSTCRSGADRTGTKPATEIRSGRHGRRLNRLERMTDESRTATPIDTIADAWVDTLAELHPTLATYIGRFEFNDRFGDYSPDGAERITQEARRTLAALEAAAPVDAVDEVTKADL